MAFKKTRPRSFASRLFFSRLTPARLFLFANLLFILAIFLIGCKPGAFEKQIKAGDLAAHNGEKVSFVGRVCEEAEVDIKSRRLTVCAGGKVLITTILYPAYNYGDFLKISGELEAPPVLEDFDYESYLARYGVYSLLYYPKIEAAAGVLSGRQKAYHTLLRFKWRLKNLLDRNLAEPEAGLAGALLLGYRRSVERSDLDLFARVGISHLIAISGTHITILSALIINFFLALGLSRRWVLRVVFAFLIFYPIITGLAASAVRSALMGGLALLAVSYGRKANMTNALVSSAALMLLFNPRILRADVGFQLSFAAVLAIIYLYPLGQKVIRRLLAGKGRSSRWKKALQVALETLNLTLVCQIAILPIALINFKQLSLIAPLTNLLLLWSFPFILTALLASLCLSALIPPLGPFFFLPAYLGLKFIFILSDLLARPSWAAVQIRGFNWWWGGLYYLFLTALIYLLRRKKNELAYS